MLGLTIVAHIAALESWGLIVQTEMNVVLTIFNGESRSTKANIEIQKSKEGACIKAAKPLTSNGKRPEVAVVDIDNTCTPRASNWEALLNANQHISDMCISLRGRDDLGKNVINDIGLYVVGHGSVDILGGLTGPELARLINKLGFDERLRKICLAACNTGHDGSADNKFLAGVALGLLPLRPLIAAYTGFMTRAHQDRKMIIRDNMIGPIPKGSSKDQKRAKLRQDVNDHGGTIVESGRNWPLSLMPPEEKAKYKIAVQCQSDGSVKQVPLTEYTDK
jgi:hypothetical protein